MSGWWLVQQQRPCGGTAPSDSSSDIRIRDVQGFEFGPHCVATLNAHGSEDQLAAPRFDIKVVGRAHGLNKAFGQGELVFGGDFGEHD